MFTVCPKCALTLVVTAADLRVAQGYVRCGRCSSVFNALAQLSDDRQAAAAPAAAEEREAPAGAPQEEQPRGEAAVPEEALEFDPGTDASSVFVAASPTPEWTAATGSFKALIAANQETANPEPVRPDPGEAAGSGQIDVELDAAMLSDAVHPAVAAQPASVPVTPPPPPSAESVAPLTEALPAAILEEGRPSSPRRSLKWAAGSVLLGLALLAQLIDHRRDSLASDPRLRPTLTQLYGALGVRLMPRWDLHAYDVRQLGATVEPGSVGAITVRAAIRNAATRPQPLPLLRVTLEDRFGNRLASREVGPREYLPPGIPAPAMLSADQRIDAELAFVDPGASAEGFEVDACLPARGGGVACANDPGAP